jgi:hypothetical protein
MSGKSVVPLRSSAVPVSTSETANDIISPASLPPSIMGGIVDLVIAFSAGPATADADRTRKLQLYGEVVAGVEVSVAEYALKRLRVHNKRNPFPPTPQDLFEECKRVRHLWHDRVIDVLISGEEWGSASSIEASFRIRLNPSDPWGPPPFTAGCFMPDRLILEALRDYIDRNADDSDSDLARMDADAFESLPEQVFGPGMRDAAITARALRVERIERERKQQDRQRWWDGLGRLMRRAVTFEIELARGLREDVSDDELEARARKRIRKDGVEIAR